MLTTILSSLNNKYVVSTAAFLVWLMFFDNNSLIRQSRLSGQLRDLKKQKAFYEEAIGKNREASRELMNDEDLLEKFARERYLMKKDNEDIFVIIRD